MIRISVILSLLMTLAACETTRGFVRDAENVGQALARGG